VTSRVSVLFAQTLFPNATHHSNLKDVRDGRRINIRLHYQRTKQDMQCTVHANTVAVETATISSTYYEYMHSFLSHRTYNVNASLYHIFPHHLLNGTIFGKKVIEHKMRVFIFFTTFH